MGEAYIGLDVHKTTISIGIAFRGHDEAISYGKCSADLNRLLVALRKLLKKYELTKGDVRVCYEAGPCGFVLARRHESAFGAPATIR